MSFSFWILLKEEKVFFSSCFKFERFLKKEDYISSKRNEEEKRVIVKD